jgi:inosine-uridine nucleoside N-ribohydrolase
MLRGRTPGLGLFVSLGMTAYFSLSCGHKEAASQDLIRDRNSRGHREMRRGIAGRRCVGVFVACALALLGAATGKGAKAGARPRCEARANENDGRAAAPQQTTGTIQNVGRKPVVQGGPGKAAGPELVIIDTDAGDDVDDVFAIGLALQSPEVKILGISSAWGNTKLRARLVERFLRETEHSDIPVAVGIEKYPTKGVLTFSQANYAKREPEVELPGAVDFILREIRKHPGEITLIAIGPETNLGAAIEKDAETFRKLKRVVLMGGSVYRGYDGFPYPTVAPKPMPEWNILCDIAAAQKVFTSGVPLYVMPLDSTQIKLQELERARLFSRGTALTDALTVLYHQWAYGTRQETPTLYDAVAVGYAIRPELCPTKALRLRVDEVGNTKVESGEANAQVCLESDSDAFLRFYMARVAGRE